MTEQSKREFETIASGIYLEGLAVDHARDVIWYSDVIGGGVHGVRPDGTRFAALNEDRMWTGGVMLNTDGAVLSSGEGGIMWNDPDGGRSGWLVAEIDGAPIGGINEMAPDGEGGIVFGTIDMENVIAGKTTRPVALYRLTVDRQLISLADRIGFTNGIMYDEARRRIYCNDTFRSTLIFDVADGFSLTGRRVFLDKDDVDGMALDAEGNVWITGFRSSHLTRVTPGGTELPRIGTPAGSITQLRFGGSDMRDLYFTSVPADGGDTLKKGGELTARNSHLYRTRAPTPGKRLDTPRFRLV